MRFASVLCVLALATAPVFAGGSDPTGDTGEVTSGPKAETPQPAADNDPCGMGDSAHLIGEHSDVLSGATFDGPVRILEFGALMTMDYLAERINFRLNEDGTIAEISCG